MAELFDHLTNRSGRGLDGERARGAAQAPVPFALGVREVEGNDGDVFPLDVLPNVQLRPVKERMNSNVSDFLEIGVKLVPELWRLILDIPFYVFVARAEIAFLGTSRFFIAAHADDHSGEVVLFQN